MCHLQDRQFLIATEIAINNLIIHIIYKAFCVEGATDVFFIDAQLYFALISGPWTSVSRVETYKRTTGLAIVTAPLIAVYIRP